MSKQLASGALESGSQLPSRSTVSPSKLEKKTIKSLTFRFKIRLLTSATTAERVEKTSDAKETKKIFRNH
ncbi:MAG: hypothetical protein ACPGPS_21115, partial [Rubripirellula sp.]